MTHRTAVRTLSLTALLLAAPVLASCSSDTEASTASTTSTPSTDPAAAEASTTSTTGVVAEEHVEGDFYAVPDPLPSAPHGTLLRYEVVTPTVAPGATTYRILYLSESVAGDPIAVSGTALVPDAPAGAEGRRLLTIAHGTTGIADECAPSKEPGSELLLMGGPVEAGWLVAMSDYEGLGTPGRHPYLVGPSEGRGVIDAILAARSLPNADAGDQLAIAGYSQGGHGALWANEVSADWAPELEVVGTFAGAPATELDVIMAAAPNLPGLSGFAFMMIAGMHEAYPDSDLSTLLTDAGVDALDTVDTGCVREVMGGFATTQEGPLIRPDGPASTEWKQLAIDNNPGNVATEEPILIIHSDTDQVVPATLSALLHNRLCGLGQAVERRVVSRGGHVEAAPPAFVDGLAWLTDRFGGEPLPASTCPA
ncbi:MAG TPA: lipase family protein [Acidimicrobiales bacterium]|nr:lipase family protein [Acidimicrobiales bacterium]